MSLNELLKLTRKRALMSQEDFAKNIRVSVATINRWENGRNKPNLTATRRIKQFCEDNKLPFDEIEKEWLPHSSEDSK